MKAVAIVERALHQLADLDELVWDAYELLEYVQAGANEIVRVKPDAYTRRASIQLQDGISQALPDDALVLVDVLASQGLSGEQLPSSVTRVDRETLDRSVPGWQSHPPRRAIVHFMYDRRDPLRFEVYPPQPLVAGLAVILYGAHVPAVASFSDDVPLDDVYANSVLDYVLYRAHSRAVQSANANVAAAHLNAFYQGLGAQQGAERAYKAPGTGR